MKVFVTGATGFIGTEVVRDLMAHGHKVVGLVRSKESANKLKAVGASAFEGSLEDLESLRRGAESADAVINCAFNNDLSQFAQNSQIERRAIETLGQALEATSKPLVVTSGVALLKSGVMGRETDHRPTDTPIPRDSESPTLRLAESGTRAMIVRLSPVTHGNGGGGFAGILIQLARKHGVSAYFGEGSNRWAAAHYADAAKLYRLALESGEAGSIYHAVNEEGVPTRAIADAIAKALGMKSVSLDGAEAEAHFGVFNAFMQMDILASSDLTQKFLSWKPQGLGLIADLERNVK